MAHVQRNVVTLSNIPPDLHQWLREEAFRQSEKAGKKVGIYNIVVQAIQKYQTDLEEYNAYTAVRDKREAEKILKEVDSL